MELEPTNFENSDQDSIVVDPREEFARLYQEDFIRAIDYLYLTVDKTSREEILKLTGVSNAHRVLYAAHKLRLFNAKSK